MNVHFSFLETLIEPFTQKNSAVIFFDMIIYIQCFKDSHTTPKVSKYWLFFWSVLFRIWIVTECVFNANTVKYGPEKVPYLDTEISKHFLNLATKRIGCDSSLCWKSCVSAGVSRSRVKRPRDCVYANQRPYHESEPMSKIWRKCTCSGSWHHGGARYFSLIALYWKNMPKHRPKLRK